LRGVIHVCDGGDVDGDVVGESVGGSVGEHVQRERRPCVWGVPAGGVVSEGAPVGCA